MKRFSLAVILVLLAGLIQNTSLFSVLGIKPNLLLAVIVGASFFIDSLAMIFILIAESIVFLRFEAGFRPELLAWVFLLLAAYSVSRILPWRRSVNAGVLIPVVMIMFYLVADFSYLWGSPLAVISEAIYTIIFGSLFYDIFRQLGDNEEDIFKR